MASMKVYHHAPKVDHNGRVLIMRTPKTRAPSLQNQPIPQQQPRRAEAEVPGHQMYIKQWPFGLFGRALGQKFSQDPKKALDHPKLL